jgi:hypothetical protein
VAHFSVKKPAQFWVKINMAGPENPKIIQLFQWCLAEAVGFEPTVEFPPR